MNFYKFYKLLNEYGDGVTQSLIDKFTKEDPTLTPDVVRSYIEKFKRIKNNLEQKDITKYTWKDLESVIDGYQTKNKIKAGKLDPTVSDSNLLYNKDGVRIYLGKDKKSCIRYSNGYTFCIGARGENNQYGRYRIGKKGTPYFIFNDNLPQSDKRHIIVLFVYKDGIWTLNYGEKPKFYTVTLANNREETGYVELSEVIREYPWAKYIKPFMVNDSKGNAQPDSLEIIEYYYNKFVSEKKADFLNKVKVVHYNDEWKTKVLLEKNIKELQEFLENKNYSVEISIHLMCYKALEQANGEYDFISYEDDFKFDGTEPLADYKIIPIKNYNEDKNIRFYSINDPIISFAKNSDQIIKKIKNEIKQFIINRSYGEEKAKELAGKLNIIDLAIDGKKQEIDKILELKEDSFSVDLDELYTNFKNLKNLMLIPYFVISIGKPVEHVKKFLDLNKTIVNRMINLDKDYNKKINWLKNQKESVLRQIADEMEKTSNNVELGTFIDSKEVDEILNKFMNNSSNI